MPSQNSWFLDVHGLSTTEAPAAIFHVYLQAALWGKRNSDLQHMPYRHCAGCYPQACCHVRHGATGTSSQKSPPRAGSTWHLGSDCKKPRQPKTASQWHHGNRRLTDKRGHQRMSRSNKYHITNVCLSSLRQSYKIHNNYRRGANTRTLRTTLSCQEWCSVSAVHPLLSGLQHEGDINKITRTNTIEA